MVNDEPIDDDPHRPRRRSSPTVVKDLHQAIAATPACEVALRRRTTSVSARLAHIVGNLASPALVTPSSSFAVATAVGPPELNVPRRLSINSRRSSMEGKNPASQGAAAGGLAAARDAIQLRV